ncbi:2-dehydropantoate 2-reductase [Kitasatospora cinereorecta]|uniref:2-dehydropantoate 2-reductase n=1 Tax=Kitasatospora cinereorecta TaxID=285560 RepID=A0ABW0VL12_9ACTN
MPTAAPLPRRPRIAVLGAGSIGCHLGGMLAATADVTLIGRPAAMAAAVRDGLTLTGPGDARRTVHDLHLATEPDAARGADYVLVTVKSADTATAGRQLADHLDPDTVVVSFQNGLHNPDVLRRELPGRTVLAGMVPYNVVRTGPAAFHQGSGGRLMLDDTPAAAALATAARGAGLRLDLRRDMAAVQAAKLLMNLNNAINALSGLPLREQLGRREYRACLALCQREALAAFRAEGITPARLGPVPPRLMPAVLGLPDALFRRLAAASLRIDAHARSSMWEDLQRSRPTEIDTLQGEIVTLAARHHLPAPANARLTTLVHQAESAPTPWPAPTLLADLRAHS